MLYQAYQAQRDLTAPAVGLAGLTVWAIGGLPDSLSEHSAVRWASATCQIVKESRLTHTRPAFGIEEVTAGGRPARVREEAVVTTPFASLLHFAKESATPQPRVLLVTALAGHFSTLLRATVRHAARRPRRLRDRLAQRPGRRPRPTAASASTTTSTTSSRFLGTSGPGPTWSPSASPARRRWPPRPS